MESREIVHRYNPGFSSGSLTPRELFEYWEARHFIDFDSWENANGAGPLRRTRLKLQLDYSLRKLEDAEDSVNK